MKPLVDFFLWLTNTPQGLGVLLLATVGAVIFAAGFITFLTLYARREEETCCER